MQQSTDDEIKTSRPNEETEELNLISWIHTVSGRMTDNYRLGGVCGNRVATVHSAPCGRRKGFRPEPGVKRRLERPQRTDGEDHAQYTECPADGRVEERKGAYEGPGEEEE